MGDRKGEAWGQAVAYGAVFALVAVWIWHRPINHDSAFLLLAAERFLDGLSFYRDQSMANPPLGPWMHAAMVAADRTLAGWGMGPLGIQVLVPFVLLACAGATALGAALLARHPDVGPRARRWLPLILFVILTVAPVKDFGQRDHLFALFALPYVILAGLRLDGVRLPGLLAGAVGATAFLGIALKPHFLLLPLMLEIAILWRLRTWKAPLRPDALTLAVLLAGYALLVVVLYPEYFTVNLPLYTQVFWAFTRPLGDLVFSPEVALVIVATVAWVLLRPRPDDGLVIAALVAAITATLIFILQKKGWSYQRAPAFVFVTWTLALLAITRRRFGSGLGRAWTVAGLGLVIALVGLRTALVNAPYQGLSTALAEASNGGPVYVFTTNVSVPFPGLQYAGITPASRFNTLWMLPALIRTRARDGDPGALADVERFARNAILEDFQRRTPAAVGVDVRTPKPYFDDVPFDYLAWALEDPRFAALWTDYALIGRQDGFTIYTRTGDATDQQRNQQ